MSIALLLSTLVVCLGVGALSAAGPANAGPTAGSFAPLQSLQAPLAVQQVQLTAATLRTVSAPAITKLSPTSGKRLAKVTISGRNFGARRGTSYVRFGTKKCSAYLSWSASRIVCRVPAAAAADKVLVKVTTRLGTSKGRSFIVVVPPPPGAWTAVSCVGYHTLAVMGDGSLWAWGWNSTRQLGLGDIINRVTPTHVGTATDWSSVSCGYQYSVALKQDGSLWAWGCNDYGQLGLGDTTDRSKPTQVGTDTAWATVSCGADFTLARKTDGSLWAWGNNLWGQLGLGDGGGGSERSIPTLVGADSDWATVSCGADFTLARKTDGSLWAWGFNGGGQLGLGDSGDGAYRLSPTRIGTGSDWPAVSCGGGHVLARKADGSLWAWGGNQWGELGLGDSGYGNMRTTPTRVGTGTDWATMSCGTGFTLACKADGSLWAWGDNGNGQLGLGDVLARAVPTQVGTDDDWVAASCGLLQSLALKSDGSLWAWGYNGYGQLGLRDTAPRITPTRVGGP